MGIRRSAQNAVLFGLVGGIGAGVVGGTMEGLGIGLNAGVIVALGVGLFFGGYACIGHLVLRWLLWRAGNMPLNYSQFLDSAAERLLVRKIGGGYTFIHRLLLDFFADAYTRASSASQNTTPGQIKVTTSADES